ncbi:protease complex subunit PrcB family protein [Flavobacterium pedocola]
MKIKTLFFSICVSVLASCNSSKEMTQKNSNDTTFKVIYSSEYGGDEKEGFEVIDSEAKLKSFYSRIQLDSEVSSSFEKIDFETSNILVLHLGQKTTGGYNVSVESIESVEDKLQVKRKIIAPKQGEFVTTALTNPYCIVSLPKKSEYLIK